MIINFLIYVCMYVNNTGLLGLRGPRLECPTSCKFVHKNRKNPHAGLFRERYDSCYIIEGVMGQ